jgi:outer membrane protein OmpA-like peptidoglycan-associated protein
VDADFIQLWGLAFGTGPEFKGDVQYIMDLSHRRATAVRDELVDTHDIDINRLGAVGMGFFAPVASNRRVELVKF